MLKVEKVIFIGLREITKIIPMLITLFCDQEGKLISTLFVC